MFAMFGYFEPSFVESFQRARENRISAGVLTNGHRDDGSGVQKHSCDGVYPWTIRVVGRDGDLFCQAWNAVTGQQGAMYSSALHGWKEAHAKAEADCEVAVSWIH